MINKSIGNSFDAYASRTSGGEFSVASTGLDYDSCKTEPVKEDVALIRQNFAIKRIEIRIEKFSPKKYRDPSVKIISIKNEMEELCASTPQPDLEKSTIAANPTTIAADGTATSEITVTLKDEQGNPLTSGGYSVVITTNFGNIGTTYFDTSSGKYKADLTGTSVGTATVGFSVSGNNSPNTDIVQIIDQGGGDDEGTDIPSTGETMLQSPNFYLQAAGSEGDDSSKGNHLRWIFRGALGELHLPKRNYAANQVNFNKPDDVVRVYRTRYRKVAFTLDLTVKTGPDIIDNDHRVWLYRPGKKEFYVHFRNTSQYDLVKNSVDPATDHIGFLQAYGPELIEVENKTQLFFSTRLIVSNQTGNNSVQAETLSVGENTFLANKIVSSRQSFDNTELGQMRMICENGRSVRYRSYDGIVDKIDFEFYIDFLEEINSLSDWHLLNSYALSLDNNRIFDELEPTAGSVNAHWLRFNDDDCVKVGNYQNKWNGALDDPDDRNIRDIVEKYIQLSNSAGNPTAIEQIPLGDSSGDTTDISHLNLLNFAAHDYHVARMLGLGTLDLDSEVFTDSYVYIAEYITFGDLQDGGGTREVQHLSMSLPTSISDQRLPLTIDLKELVLGVFYSYDGEPTNLADEGGYSFDGKTRYISIFAKAVPRPEANLPFFASYQEFSAEKFTFPVYAGLEHKMNSETEWQKPELSNDPEYQNVLTSGADGKNETLPILAPDENKPLYVHAQKKSGWHRYASYGINWFSRATTSEIVESIYTDLQPSNKLLPPSNVQPFLIRQENPPTFTSADEQSRLDAITGTDKTLVRLLFDYHSFQELIEYVIPLDSSVSNSQYESDPNLLYPDAEEVFAEEAEIYFRNQIPSKVTGKALQVNPHPSNPLLAIIKTGPFDIGSSGENPTEQIIPTVAPGEETNYAGGVFTIGQQQYIIHEVDQTGNGPDFTVYNKVISDAITDEIPDSNIDLDNLEMPELTEDGFFMAVENMQNNSSWGTPNPSSFKVQIGNNWSVNREVFEIENPGDGNISRQLEKTRGIWSDPSSGEALVEKELEPEAVLDSNGNPQYNSNGDLIIQDVHKGLYKITFNGIQLSHHPQYSTTQGQPSVDWHRGIARVFTENAILGGTPKAKRKVLKVEKIINVGASSDLVIYAQDPTFSNDSGYDSVKTGNNISVNFYPSYRVYLYADTTMGLSEANTLPDTEDVRYTVFGLRSHDHDYSYYSKMSLPGLLFAQRIVVPLRPEQPEGALYATRPDFFGRSTYTLTTEYQQKPYGVLFHRANDEALLNALYEKDTILDIRETLKAVGRNDEEYFTNRWQNFVNFDELAADGDYKVYPPADVSPDGYKFPNPDKQALFDWANEVLAGLGQTPITANAGTLPVGDPQLIEFVKGAIYNVFVPLTELPIIYQYVQGSTYEPVDKKQNIKDRNGYALSPTNSEFEMAPMMKIINGSPHKTQFTDFKLDGYSNNFYFYGVKEMGSQMKIGEFSPFLGPIKLVNTNAPEAPEVKSIVPQLENPVLGTLASIRVNINAYPELQKIEKINLYRAFRKIDAQSIRTMELVKSIIIDETMLSEPIWRIVDEFEGLQEIPYGDGLFYRVVVGRKVEYADKNNILVFEYAPSKPSKILVSMVMENSNPPAPVLEYTSDQESNGVLPNVVLSWDKTCYNGKYHLYKMNNQGNWMKIHSLQSNDENIVLDLANTDLGTNDLDIINADGAPIYHHFKVVAENTAGMLSQEENILTVPSS